MTTDAIKMAQQCASKMQIHDDCLRMLGVTLLPITTAGQATCTMPVTKDLTNGHDICFGGFIFSLADLAFAYACNAYNVTTVAQHCSVTFIRPTFVGDTLSAHAIERSRGKRSGIYDITITNQDNKTVAEFRGHSTSLGTPIIT